MSGCRGFRRLPAVATALAVLVLNPGSASAGGTPVGFVSLPARGTLVVITLPNGGTLDRIKVPGQPAAVAASMNGRRVLVASPGAGAVTEIDGVHRRVLRVFRGLARPADVAFDYEPPIGIVTPRYAFVLERARGMLAVFDLGRGRIASRLAVGAQPERLAVAGTTLWIAHARSGTLTRVDVTAPAKPRLLANVETGGTVDALVADPELHSVFVLFRHSGVVARYVDKGVSSFVDCPAWVARVPLVGLAIAPRQLLIASDRDGVLYVRHEQSGRRVAELHAPPGIRSLDVYGGWLVAILPRGLSLMGVPDGSTRTSVAFPTRVGGFGWAVL